jgi:hypothetical protein
MCPKNIDFTFSFSVIRRLKKELVFNWRRLDDMFDCDYFHMKTKTRLFLFFFFYMKNQLKVNNTIINLFFRKFMNRQRYNSLESFHSFFS